MTTQAPARANASKHVARRVLIVEDSPSDLHLIKAMLVSERHDALDDVDHVATLSMAEEYLLAGTPQCVLLDLGLPDSEGLATLARIRSTSPDVPIVVLTGIDSEHVGLEAVAGGAQDYLVKGQIDNAELCRALRFAIHRQHLDNEMRQHNQRRLSHLTQRVRTLTLVDHLLVNATEEQVLIEGMCRVIAEAGEYSGAYVAVHGADDGVELHGFHVNDSSLVPETADEVDGPHPLFQALRGSRSVLADGAVAVPVTLATASEEMRRVYRRLGAFPFDAGRSQSCLVVFSNDANALREPEECKALERVAADIAFGLTSIQQRDELLRYSQRLQGSVDQMARTIAALVEYRDPYTAGHQRSVALLAAAIGHEMHLDEDRIMGLSTGAGIHDVGKICVPAEILAKPGRLSPAEIELIKQHPLVGSDMVKAIDFPWPVQEMIAQHHERMDGSGYPHGASGKAILLESRIIAVADTVDAMVAHRPYRPSRGLPSALGYIQANRGLLFDPAVVDACVDVLSSGRFPLAAEWPTAINALAANTRGSRPAG